MGVVVVLACIEIGKRLPHGVDDFEAAGERYYGPWRRKAAVGHA
jgi:hypothetical protein